MITEAYVNAWQTLAQKLSADELIARIRSDIAGHTLQPVPTPADWSSAIGTLRLVLLTQDQKEAFAFALRRDEVALGQSLPEDDKTRQLAGRLLHVDQRIGQLRLQNRERAAFATEVRAAEAEVAELTTRLALVEEDVRKYRQELSSLT